MKLIDSNRLFIAAAKELLLVKDLASLSRRIVLYARNLVEADGATFVLKDGDRCF